MKIFLYNYIKQTGQQLLNIIEDPVCVQIFPLVPQMSFTANLFKSGFKHAQHTYRISLFCFLGLF